MSRNYLNHIDNRLLFSYYAIKQEGVHMITLGQANDFVKSDFDEADSMDRITELEFAYHVSTQPREYIDSQDPMKMTLGSGPLIILKMSGKVYPFSSSPLHLAISNAKTAEQFDAELEKLSDAGYPVQPTHTIGPDGNVYTRQ